MIHQKLNPYLAILLITLIASGTTFLLLQHNAAIETGDSLPITVRHQASGTTDNSVNTSDWKTYRNEEYGFEVKYPSTLDPLDAEPTSVDMLSSLLFYDGSGFEGFCRDNPDLIECGTEMRDQRKGFILQIYQNKDGLNSREFFRTAITPYLTFGDSEKIVKESNTISVGSLSVVTGEVLDTTNDRYYYFLDPSNNIAFVVRGRSSTLIENVLAAFKFISPLDTSTWKTYSPREVTGRSEELDGTLIEITGVITWVPFVDQFGLGGASAGFVTNNGSIAISVPNDIHKFIDKNVIARGIYNASAKFLSMNCAGCGLRHGLPPAGE